jgi:hypothetical protein
MGQLFEAAMMICFGLSWPSAVRKSWVSRTARGKSLLFECLILTGYICGIVGKILTGNVNYVLILYVINLAVVSVDFVLLLRNMSLDKEADRAAADGEEA